MTTAFERVTAALAAAGSSRHSSGNWNCPGPGHERGDVRASLHLTSDASGAGLYCHLRCETKDILAVLGLTEADLFDEPLPQAEAIWYRYRDEAGQVVFAKLRWPGKGFSIRHPLPDGSWIPGIGDAQRVLYRLPELISAVFRGEPVYLVEGEKDAERMALEGVCATTNYDGAGKWRPEYTRWLADADVTIIADRDEPGVAHARKAAAELEGHARSIRIVQSRTEGKGHDISDHLDAGFTLDELVPYHPGSEIADRYTPVDWRTAWKEEAARIKWLVEPVLEEGTLCALYGRPGDGKSLITLWLCLQIVRSGGTVLMCDDENTRTDLVARLKAFGASPEELDNLITLNFASLPPLDTPEGGRHLTALADKYSPAMITLDTISRMVEGEENSATTYLQLYRNSMTPLKARGICVLRIDHSGKETARGQRGSSAKSGDVDVVWRLSRESEDFLVLEREKSRNGHGDPTVVLQKLDHPCLHFEWDACSLVDGQVIELAKRLDRYGAALDCTRESAEAMLHEYSIGARHEKVSAALKYRRDNARGQGTGGNYL